MQTITVTARELHAIAKDLDREEHNLLWNNGAQMWDIYVLACEIEDECLLGMGEDSAITLTADGLSEPGANVFISGFCDAAPESYSMERDFETDCPWAAPWYWIGKDEWFNPKLTVYEMGRAWAERNHAEVEELFTA